MEVGPLFVENRYTDFHNYWPHQTLRNLWQLSRWIDPRRLRMEFLNHSRNTDLYPGDSLAPSQYDPATLFSTVMFGNPLGWFEVSNLPDGYIESVADLVAVWKEHREALFDGTVLGIGEAPDGRAFTGFLSLADGLDDGYALVFREYNEDSEAMIQVAAVDLTGKWEVLSSKGDARIDSDGSCLKVSIAERFGYVFAQFTR